MKRYMLVCSLILVLSLSLGVLSACSGAADSDYPYAPAADAAPADSYWPDSAGEAPGDIPAPAGDAAPAPGDPEAAPSDSAGSAGPPPILTPGDSGGRRLIYTVDIQLQTTDFMSGIRLLYNTISELDGFIMSEQVYGRDMRTPEYERSASYSFRLFTDNLPEFIVILEDNYNLLGRQLSANDVTAVYEHQGFTLGDLREQEERIKNALDDDELDDDVINELERALLEVQALIRSLEMQQSTLDDDILYSFINVQLFEVIFIEEVEEEEEEVVVLTFGERFAQEASRSWSGFVAFLQGFSIVLIRILPTLLILGVITAVTILIIRKYKTWRIANPKKPKPAKTSAYTGYQPLNNNLPYYYEPCGSHSAPNTSITETEASTDEKPNE